SYFVSCFPSFRSLLSFPTRRSSDLVSIEREGGFLPPSHFPRCSVTDIFSEVFRQSEYCCISPFYNCTDGAKDWAKAADTIVRCCLKIRVVDLFPYPEEFNCVSVSQPVGDEKVSVFRPEQICYCTAAA